MFFVPVIARAMRNAGISGIVLAEFERQFSQDELRRRFGNIPLRDLSSLTLGTLTAAAVFETLRISAATFFQCVASMEVAGWALWDIWPDDCLYVTRLEGRVMLHKGKGF